MSARRRRILVTGLAVVGTVVAVTAAVKLRQRQQVAGQAAEAILTQLDEMDPVTRVMVERRLATQAAHDVQDKLSKMHKAERAGS